MAADGQLESKECPQETVPRDEEEEAEKIKIVTGDGDRIEQKNENPDEESAKMKNINQLIDQLVTLSTEGQDLSPVTKERVADLGVARNQPKSVGSKYFPLRPDATPFVTKTLGYVPMNGPNEKKIKAFVEKTGYPLHVTPHQRTFGPPENWEGPVPGAGCQVFVGRIPKQLFEDTLVPLFMRGGRIHSFRLMMEGDESGLSRGYAFVIYGSQEEAAEAVHTLDEFEVIKGRPIKVAISEPVCRLFLGNIPKSISKDDLKNFLTAVLDGVQDVIVYAPTEGSGLNRGFCFVDFDTHANASQAKKRIQKGTLRIFGCHALVDWADPQQEPEDDVMKGVKVLYVKGLTKDIKEEDILASFMSFGSVERVKKIKDYAFVHFAERNQALDAMTRMNGTEIKGVMISVTLAKPPLDKTIREEILRNREKRILSTYGKKVAQAGSNGTGVQVVEGKLIICGNQIILVKDPTKPSTVMLPEGPVIKGSGKMSHIPNVRIV